MNKQKIKKAIQSKLRSLLANTAKFRGAKGIRSSAIKHIKSTGTDFFSIRNQQKENTAFAFYAHAHQNVKLGKKIAQKNKKYLKTSEKLIEAINNARILENFKQGISPSLEKTTTFFNSFGKSEVQTHAIIQSVFQKRKRNKQSSQEAVIEAFNFLHTGKLFFSSEDQHPSAIKDFSSKNKNVLSVIEGINKQIGSAVVSVSTLPEEYSDLKNYITNDNSTIDESFSFSKLSQNLQSGESALVLYQGRNLIISKNKNNETILTDSRLLEDNPLDDKIYKIFKTGKKTIQKIKEQNGFLFGESADSVLLSYDIEIKENNMSDLLVIQTKKDLQKQLLPPHINSQKPKKIHAFHRKHLKNKINTTLKKSLSSVENFYDEEIEVNAFLKNKSISVNEQNAISQDLTKFFYHSGQIESEDDFQNAALLSTIAVLNNNETKQLNYFSQNNKKFKTVKEFHQLLNNLTNTANALKTKKLSIYTYENPSATNQKKNKGIIGFFKSKKKITSNFDVAINELHSIPNKNTYFLSPEQISKKIASAEADYSAVFVNENDLTLHIGKDENGHLQIMDPQLLANQKLENVPDEIYKAHQKIHLNHKTNVFFQTGKVLDPDEDKEVFVSGKEAYNLLNLYLQNSQSFMLTDAHDNYDNEERQNNRLQKLKEKKLKIKVLQSSREYRANPKFEEEAPAVDFTSIEKIVHQNNIKSLNALSNVIEYFESGKLSKIKKRLSNSLEDAKIFEDVLDLTSHILESNSNRTACSYLNRSGLQNKTLKKHQALFENVQMADTNKISNIIKNMDEDDYILLDSSSAKTQAAINGAALIRKRNGRHFLIGKNNTVLKKINLDDVDFKNLLSYNDLETIHISSNKKRTIPPQVPLLEAFESSWQGESILLDRVNKYSLSYLWLNTFIDSQGINDNFFDSLAYEKDASDYSAFFNSSREFPTSAFSLIENIRKKMKNKPDSVENEDEKIKFPVYIHKSAPILLRQEANSIRQENQLPLKGAYGSFDEKGDALSTQEFLQKITILKDTAAEKSPILVFLEENLSSNNLITIRKNIDPNAAFQKKYTVVMDGDEKYISQTDDPFSLIANKIKDNPNFSLLEIPPNNESKRWAKVNHLDILYPKKPPVLQKKLKALNKKKVKIAEKSQVTFFDNESSNLIEANALFDIDTIDYSLDIKSDKRFLILIRKIEEIRTDFTRRILTLDTSTKEKLSENVQQECQDIFNDFAQKYSRWYQDNDFPKGPYSDFSIEDLKPHLNYLNPRYQWSLLQNFLHSELNLLSSEETDSENTRRLALKINIDFTNKQESEIEAAFDFVEQTKEEFQNERFGALKTSKQSTLKRKGSIFDIRKEFLNKEQETSTGDSLSQKPIHRKKAQDTEKPQEKIQSSEQGVQESSSSENRVNPSSLKTYLIQEEGRLRGTHVFLNKATHIIDYLGSQGRVKSSLKLSGLRDINTLRTVLGEVSKESFETEHPTVFYYEDTEWGFDRPIVKDLKRNPNIKINKINQLNDIYKKISSLGEEGDVILMSIGKPKGYFQEFVVLQKQEDQRYLLVKTEADVFSEHTRDPITFLNTELNSNKRNFQTIYALHLKLKKNKAE